MSEQLEQKTDSILAEEERDDNFWSKFSWEHPLVKVFGFGFGDLASLVLLVNSSGWLANVLLGAVIATTLGLLYSVTLTFIEHRRKERLYPVKLVPNSIDVFIDTSKQLSNLPEENV